MTTATAGPIRRWVPGSLASPTRVDALGGKLTLRSLLGEGTSLVIELPLEPAGELNGCGCAHLHLCRWLGISIREVLD